MMASSQRWRVFAAALCAVVSTGAGCMLLFRLVTPDTVGKLATYELLGLLGLVVLPWITLWAFMVDRRLSRQTMTPERAHAAAAHESESAVPAATSAAVPSRDPAHGRIPGRQVERHRRRSDDNVRAEHELARRG